jgi:glycosyltransferase involved in cell wall biosynthesis
MRIVYLNAQHLPTTEVDSHQVVKTVSALAAEGADIELIVPHPLAWHRRTVNELEEQVRRYYAVRHPFRLRPVPTMMRTPWQMERAVAAFIATAGLRFRPGFDILYIRNYLCTLSAYAAGLHFVLEAHRLLPKHYPGRARAVRRMRERNRITGVVTNGDMITKVFLDLGFSPEQVLTAHNGFDPQDLEPLRTREEARAQLKLHPDEHIVFYGGHLQPHKGVDIFIELARQTPDIKYVLAGGTPRDLEWFKTLMSPYELKNIQLLGWKPHGELVDYMYASDVLIIPPSSAPLWEYGRTTYPMKLYGYLATGRPIVAPRTPDVAEVIKDGETGFLVRPDDPQHTADVLRKVFGDPGYAERIGTAAQEAAQQFTWRRRAQLILAHLENLLSRRSGREGGR